ncbi:MAG: cell envelope integrity protein CreD [Chitinophagaceae bacterium]|nr:cell envelope integrity protein CreD [Chitinophagaceae bacterium]
MRLLTSVGLALKIWILTSIVFGLGALAYSIFFSENEWIIYSLFATPIAAVASIPVLIILILTVSRLKESKAPKDKKMRSLFLVCLGASFIYALPAGFILGFAFSDDSFSKWLISVLMVTTLLFVCSSAALLFLQKNLSNYFVSLSNNNQLSQSDKMETHQHQQVSAPADYNTSAGNKTVIKGIITGILILVMMIPTIFITNLVHEREARQKEVAAEVSSKWASSQTLTGPYLYLPYKIYYKDKEGKTQESSAHFWVLPDDLKVTGRVDHEIRPRSIYKVLLYRANLQDSGNFILQIPSDVDANAIKWAEAKICYGLSDFKGIEERLAIRFGGKEYELSPGLPFNDINKTGLSAGIPLSTADIGKTVSFDMNLRLKGSEQLHFVPLSGTSNFTLRSGWGSPSFDGNNLPTEREVTPKGFNASWAFNKANLPFGTILKDFQFDLDTVAFGVTMLQPADQYAKTSRSVKYAILFIGLTFALFFIVELTQKRPVHPVQYVLIGLALVIFYTLLLSISEFMLFDNAYLIAALATVSLITIYARGHFGNWKSAGLFCGILSALYGFIFVLIRLEDTALLVGSIGLFVVLALVMYASRKINWYGTPAPFPVSNT